MRYLVVVCVFMLILPVHAAMIDQVAVTTNAIDAARNSGAPVDDLIKQLNGVNAELDHCGWDACNVTTKQAAQQQLDQITSEAHARQRHQVLWIYLLVGALVFAFLQRRYDLIHRFHWLLLKYRFLEESS